MKILFSFFFLIAGAFALGNFMRPSPSTAKRPPTNHATLQLENIWRAIKLGFAIFLVQVDEWIGKAGFGRAPVALNITADEQILKAVEGLNLRLLKIDEIEKAVGEGKSNYDAVTRVVAEVKLELDNFRKQQIALKASHIRRHGEVVSRDTAAYLGALMLAAGIKQERFSGKVLSFAESEVQNIIGKSALTSSDIPLPVEYSGDVVELVYEYGQGRKLATVFPMGALTVKLPKLTTDTAFGIIAASGTVTEVSPAVAFVTFTADKFGGLIRLPSEIDEDSIVSMGQFLARYTARQIAKVEDTQVFISTGAGTTVNGNAAGLIAAANTDACKYALSGSTSGGKTSISQATLADFRNLRSSSTLSGIVLKNAKYYLHPTFEALLVSFNTSATVQPYQRATASSPATLDGFPIEWINVMPVFTTSAVVSTGYVLFGDASYQYLGLRNGIRFDTSREAGFATDEILVRAIERMTVGLMASKAVAVLQTDAS